MEKSILESVGLSLILLALVVGAVLVPALHDVTLGATWEGMPGALLSSHVAPSVAHETDADGNG